MSASSGCSRLDAERAHDGVAGAVQHADERGEGPAEQLERPGRDQRGRLGLLDRDRLRGQLAEHHVQHRDDDEGDDDRRQRRRRRAKPDRLEDRLQELRERRLAEPAQAQAGERDAELAGGEVPVDVLDLPAREHGVAAPLLGELLEPRRPRAGQGELGGDEEAVQQHQEECRDELDRVRQRSGWVSTAGMIPEAPRRPPDDLAAAG
jgi:hypothetical protein